MRNLKTAISIPENLFLQADETAKVLGLNRSRLYTAAIAEFLEKHREDNIKAKLNEIYADESSRVDPIFNNAQMVGLAKEDW
jgi:post-segregation antitoxin (ccd killing protein)